MDITSPIATFKKSLAEEINASLALTVEGRTLESHVKANLSSRENVFRSLWGLEAPCLGFVGMFFGLYHDSFIVTHLSLLVFASMGIPILLRSRSETQTAVKAARACHLAVRLRESPDQARLNQMNLLDPRTWNSACLISITGTLQQAEKTQLQDNPRIRAANAPTPKSQIIKDLIQQAQPTLPWAQLAKWTRYATIALVAATAYLNMRAIMQPSFGENFDFGYLDMPSDALLICSLALFICSHVSSLCSSWEALNAPSRIRLETTRDLLARALKKARDQTPSLQVKIDQGAECLLYHGLEQLKAKDFVEASE